MALHPNFPNAPHAILDPAIRWFPADEALRTTGIKKLLLPPLVPTLRKEVQAWRDSGYDGATATSKALLRWWFIEQHLLPQADGLQHEFRYYFAQREALETIVYLHDVVGVKDKFDLLRFDSSGSVSTGMFDETWRPGDPLEAAELAFLVRATLVELPADYEQLLTAKYLDGESVYAIAVRERCTPVAIRSKLARARLAFREAYEKPAPKPDRPVGTRP